MRRESPLRHLRRHGCYLKREGRAHSLWCNPQTGQVEAVPGHAEIPNLLAKKICRGLSLPDMAG
jgi:mRNA interferase HicA